MVFGLGVPTDQLPAPEANEVGVALGEEIQIGVEVERRVLAGPPCPANCPMCVPVRSPARRPSSEKWCAFCEGTRSDPRISGNFGALGVVAVTDEHEHTATNRS